MSALTKESNAGGCVELMAALAPAYPGYVATLASSTYLLGGSTGKGASVEELPWCLTAHSLPMLEHAQRAWEGAQGQYPVTLAFLGLTEALVLAGVNEACVKVSVTLVPC